MRQYTLTFNDDGQYGFTKAPVESVIMTTNADDLSALLDLFKCFVLACGFNPKGELDFHEE